MHQLNTGNPAREGFKIDRSIATMDFSSLLDLPLLLLAIFAAALLLFSRFGSVAPGRSPRLPSSPPALPIIGNLHHLTRHPHRSLRNLSLRYGPLMLLRLGRVPVLVASSPDTARLFLCTHDKIFADRPKSFLFEKLLYRYQDVATAPYGEYWRQTKSVCVLYMLSNTKVRSFRHVREEEVADVLNKIETRLISSSTSDAEQVDLTEAFTALTNNVVCRAALGRKYEGEKNFDRLLGKMLELLGGFSIGDYVPWLFWMNWVTGMQADRVARELDEFLESVIEEHEKMSEKCDGQEGWDFVDVLLWIQRENQRGLNFSRDTLKALILDVFSAGTDTTSTALEWAMTELLRHPQIMTNLHNEIRRIVGNKSFVTENDLQDIPYLKAVIKETLRLHPPIPFLLPHVSMENVTVEGYDIPGCTQVLINAWAIGRDPQTWGTDAEEFKPERFLDCSVDFHGQDFKLIPFGAGRRMCPGIAFAAGVYELALANFVHRFDWSLPCGSEGLDITETTGLTIRKKFPLVASATLA